MPGHIGWAATTRAIPVMWGVGLLEISDAGGNRVFNAVLSAKGGEACVVRLGVTHCLGIALPLR